MRRDAEFFGDQELELVYMARRLKEALNLETVLTEAGIDYAVETGEFQSGILFRSQRVGAFFYVAPENEETVRRLLREKGYKSGLLS